MTHKFMAFILISKEEFLLCKILLKETDCKLNVVQHLSKVHLRYLIFERKSLNGHVNFPFTFPIPNSISVLSAHQKIMSGTALSQSIKDPGWGSNSLPCPLVLQKVEIKVSCSGAQLYLLVNRVEGHLTVWLHTVFHGNSCYKSKEMILNYRIST